MAEWQWNGIITHQSECFLSASLNIKNKNMKLKKIVSLAKTPYRADDLFFVSHIFHIQK